jgi:hypothetical protein
MQDRINEFILSCSQTDFGGVNLSEGQEKFRTDLNNEVISHCKSLPISTQADALLLFRQHFRIPFGQELALFNNYYAPSWSIVYWLARSGFKGQGLKLKTIKNAKTAHSMALLLHPIDDHLNDNQLPATHLAVLIRSQFWMIMNNAWNSLAREVDGGKEAVDGFLDDYYSSIMSSKKVSSLDSYCDHFRRQMATGFVVPVLLSKKIYADDEFTGAIQTAYGSFGVAWRLLDDINDIVTDMSNVIHSAVYYCLSDDIRSLWDKFARDRNNDLASLILDFVIENSVIGTIKKRICNELHSAASIADDCSLKGLSEEFRCLSKPLTSSREEL